MHDGDVVGCGGGAVGWGRRWLAFDPYPCIITPSRLHPPPTSASARMIHVRARAAPRTRIQTSARAIVLRAGLLLARWSQRALPAVISTNTDLVILTISCCVHGLCSLAFWREFPHPNQHRLGHLNQHRPGHRSQHRLGQHVFGLSRPAQSSQSYTSVYALCEYVRLNSQTHTDQT